MDAIPFLNLSRDHFGAGDHFRACTRPNFLFVRVHVCYSKGIFARFVEWKLRGRITFIQVYVCPAASPNKFSNFNQIRRRWLPSIQPHTLVKIKEPTSAHQILNSSKIIIAKTFDISISSHIIHDLPQYVPTL